MAVILDCFQWLATRPRTVLAPALAAIATLAPAIDAHAIGPARPGDRSSVVQRIAVFGTDDRVPVPARYAHLAERIGVLFNNRARSVCTAFCVAPGMVATAAHCVTQQAPGKSALRAADFLFARAYDTKRDYARVEGFAFRSGPQHILSGDFHLNVRPPIDAVKDWALVRLARPLCPGGGLTVRVLPTPEIIRLSKTGKIFQISYHRDLPNWRPAYDGGCTVTRDFRASEWTAIAADFEKPEDIVLHTCDTGGASSGSPIFLDSDSGPAVIAMNVGTYVQTRIMPQAGLTAEKPKSETIANTAINARSFADHIALMRAANILRSGTPVRQVQEYLVAMKLYAGRVDGDYGPLLKSAIVAYETHRGLPVTGLPTLSLMHHLRDEVRAASRRALIPSVGASRAPTSPPRPR